MKKTYFRTSSPRFLLLPDRTHHSANQLAEMFGVNQSTISRNAKKGKTTWTRQELIEWAARMESDPRRTGGFRDRSLSGNHPIRNIDDVIYSPGPMERALMGVR